MGNRKPRAADRHSKQSKRYSPEFLFAGIDGEGIKTADGDRYVLLQVDGYPPLINLSGLRTKEICDFLMTVDRDTCLIGYGFNYDFENFFLDLTELEYTNLVNGYAVFHEGYTLSYVPKKILRVLEGDHVGYDGTLFYAAGERRTIYNCISFFQSTFIKALQSFDLADLITEEIESGKAARGTFTSDDLPKLIEYNAQECRALTRLMTIFWNQCRDGFRLARVPIALRKRDCYGPGAFASAFLKSIDWTEHYPIPWYKTDRFCADLDARLLRGIDGLEKDDETGTALIRHFPFSSCFYGGRIELAAVGEFDELHNYDLISAYPAAMSRLPAWSIGDSAFTKDSRWIARQIEKRSIGMFLVRWKFPAGWQWYPLPYRSPGKNVFFPAEGIGWIMSPELFAVLDTGLGKYIGIEAAYYLRGTGGFGDGVNEIPEPLRTPASEEIHKLFRLRREFKQSGDAQTRGAQLPLKLTLNSCYGKLLQQIGATIDNPRFFNDVCASWITGWTRATIWRAIAGCAKDPTIVAVQTDGIYSTTPLSLNFGDNLGQWESEICHDVLMLLPGIYQYRDAGGKLVKKQRGQTRYFDHECARDRLYGKTDSYVYTFPAFIGLRHAIAQPNKYGDKRLQWVDVAKEFAADLSSKRASPRDIVLRGRRHKFYPPKRNRTAEFCARPFTLKFGKTPYLIADDSALIEDSRDDELFIAGIQE